MSKKIDYKSFSDPNGNADGVARISSLVGATETTMLIRTPAQIDTTNEIVTLAVTEAARNFGPKWQKERPQVIVTSFTSAPQEYRLIKGERTTRPDGSSAMSFTTPVEGNGDYDWANDQGKVMPYGDPIDCNDEFLEDIPKSAHKVLGATKRVKFGVTMNAEAIAQTLMKSITDFDSAKEGRGRIYVVQGAENFLGFTTFNEHIRKQTEYYRNIYVNGIAIILLVPPSYTDTPDCLKEVAFTIDWKRPNKTYWRETIQDYVNIKQMKMDQDDKGNPIVGISPQELERCVSANAGMTRARGEASLLICVSEHSKIIPEVILKEKASQIRDYGLTLITPKPNEEIGGLQRFQEFLDVEVACSTPEAIGFGLKGSRMVIFAGPPGTGKSLAVKVLAKRTARPLIRLGATDLRKKYVGEGPKMLKLAIELAASMDGIIWIDEVEKLVQNVSADRDGGSNTSMLSLLLTEIQENESNIMFAFTANRVEMLPPEFVDRSNAKFLFGYPASEEQLEILEICVRRFTYFDGDKEIPRNPDDYPLEKLLKYTDGANGRQIANAVELAFKLAFERSRGREEPGLDDFIEAINRNSMNSTPQKELELIRDNCLNRGFLPANTETEEEAEVVDYGEVGIAGRA
tara:strand:+ start:9053 stop:10945 length:1893 start_codon:yes stop_codon:yes gene_type:complete